MRNLPSITGISLLLLCPVLAGDPEPPEVEMVSIPAGSFVMGDAVGEFDEKPEHRVTLSAFQMARYEITVAQYRAFAEASGREMPPAPDRGWQPDHPVVNVSWNDAEALAAWLSARTGHTYRLPTEAEWAYVARTGGGRTYATGDDGPGGNVADETGKNRFGKRRWVGYRDRYVEMAPVGTFEANAFGVYDLDGNAAEWCRNLHYEYDAADATDPQGPSEGKNRVFRGASFRTNPWYSRIAQRNFMPPDFRADYLGIRLVRVP